MGLTNLHEKTKQEPEYEVGMIRRPIGEIEAGIPPFKPGLAYTSPARGHWTIAHTPMLIPGCYMIYLCANACMRGVVLSSLEYGGMDRFSMIMLYDKDIYEGNLEQMMIDGICEIIEKQPEHPPMVIAFTSCIHHFLACDQNYIFRTLRAHYPDIDFLPGAMIPTIRKGQITPEEMLQITLYGALEKQEQFEERSVNIIGCNYPHDPGSDLYRMLAGAGFLVRDLPAMKVYAEYKDMAKSRVNFYTAPVAHRSAKKLEKRLGQQAVYVPATCSFSSIKRELALAAETLAIELPDLDAWEAQAEAVLAKAKAVIGDAYIAIDHEVIPHFISMARMLAEHGFCVREIYADFALPEEEEDLRWLQEHHPEITYCATTNYACRLADCGLATRADRPVLAIGQKAAYFTGTNHFVNMQEYNGLWGFTGICRLADLMIEAFQTESDVPELIQVKGLGCSAEGCCL